MLEQDGGLAQELAFGDDELRDANARVEVQVVERHRLLEDVPHGLLRVEEEQVAVPGQHTLGEALAEADLGFHVAVELGGFLVDGGASHKVVVLIKPEEGPAVEVLDDAVHVEFLHRFVIFLLDGGDLRHAGERHGQEEREKKWSQRFHLCG